MGHEINKKLFCLFAIDFSDYQVSRQRREDPDFEEQQLLKELLHKHSIPYCFIPDRRGDPVLSNSKRDYVGLEEVRENISEIKNFLYEN